MGTGRSTTDGEVYGHSRTGDLGFQVGTTVGPLFLTRQHVRNIVPLEITSLRTGYRNTGPVVGIGLFYFSCCGGAFSIRPRIRPD